DMGESPLMHTTPDGYASREANWLSPAAMAKRVRLAMGVATERIPFARAEDNSVSRLQSLAQGAKAGLMRGDPCSIDVASIERLVGPVSTATRLAATGLSTPERAALLLASPEFMRR